MWIKELRVTNLTFRRAGAFFYWSIMERTSAYCWIPATDTGMPLLQVLKSSMSEPEVDQTKLAVGGMDLGSW